MNERQRIAYLDIVKLIAMISVCLYHFPMDAAAPYSSPLAAGTLVRRYLIGLNAVCVPLFMMVNGALLMGGRFDCRKHALRTVKLVAGVYVWYLITQIIGHLARDGAHYLGGHLTGILYSALFLYEYDGIALTHLWFVQMLAAVYLLLPLLRAAWETKETQLRQGLAFFACAMVFFCFLVHDFDHVKALLPGLRYLDLSCIETMNPLRGRYGAMVVYFLLGGALHAGRDRLARLPLWAPAAMFGAGSLVLFAEWYAMTVRTEAVYDIVYYGYNCLPTMAMACGVFLLAMRLADRLPAVLRRVSGFVGRNTLAIYYLHWIFGLLFVEGQSFAGSFPLNLAKAAAMVLAGALLGEGMRRIPVLRWLV